MARENVKDLSKAQTIRNAVVKLDEDACTRCGLCVLNCIFRCWETDGRGVPHLRADYLCINCFNCQIACPAGAISIVGSDHVPAGHYTTPQSLPWRMPLEPRSADGKPDEWNAVERIVFNRRSVRNYRDRPVPEPLIRRVIEAGRFAPSGANGQPWQFVVVTNQAIIDEMNDYIRKDLKHSYDTHVEEKEAIIMAASRETDSTRALVASCPSPLEGVGYSVGGGMLPALLGAPVVVLICVDQKGIGGANAPYIAAQNMTLVAKSLGIGSCFVGLATRCNSSPELLEKLQLRPPFKISTSVVMGYPKFRQEGLVPREFRPIIWHREGTNGPELEE